jgi:predicted RNA binding protein YcfA (HicA-like mRNA interferase family)
VLRKVAASFLYGHEYFHHKSEVWATRTELIQRIRLYDGPYEAEFRRHEGTDLWTEEAVANAFGWVYAKAHTKKIGLTKLQSSSVMDALREYIHLSPPGYRVGGTMLSRRLQLAGERRLAEEYLRAADTTLPPVSEAAWGAFSNAFTGLTRPGSAVNYIVRRNSSLYSRLPLKGRFVRRRDLLRKLKKLGCSFVRPGGSHDIWQGPAGKFQVPRHAGDLATGTVKDILRRSGIGLRVRDLRLS